MSNQMINLTPYRFRELIKAHVSLDEVFLLQLAVQGLELDFGEKKIQVLVKGMQRKGYISEEGAITQAGTSFWESLFLPEEETLQLNKLSKTVDDFERWWKEFPSNDGFEHKGKKFPATRSMRIKKEDCKAKFHKILSEGEYTADQLIGALRAELQAKKDISVQRGRNEVSYMSGTLPYLNGRKYEGFIGLDAEPQKEIKQIQKFL